MLAKQAQEAASGGTDAEQRAATTYALLAIYHELRHNDHGAKIDTLMLQMRKVAAWQEQRAETESELVVVVRELKAEVTTIKFAVEGS
jgi:hypothetical protein